MSLLRPFFPAGWGELPNGVADSDASYLATDAAISLSNCGELREALAAYVASLRSDLESENSRGLRTGLNNIAVNLNGQNLLAKALRVDALALDLAAVLGDEDGLFASRLHLFSHQSRTGQRAEAEATWRLLDCMGRDWSRAVYRPGTAEFEFAQFQFRQVTLQDDHLATAERLAAEGKNRKFMRRLHRLRGGWMLERGEWSLAAESFHEAIRMARESSFSDARGETGLALAKFHLGQLAEPGCEAERLAQLREPAHHLLALLWLAIGDPVQAKPHALAAYEWAWADGEPYVDRYELTKTTELLRQMNIPIPNLRPYNSAKDEKFPWEDDVAAAIAKLRARKEAEKKGEDAGERPM